LPGAGVPIVGNTYYCTTEKTICTCTEKATPIWVKRVLAATDEGVVLSNQDDGLLYRMNDSAVMTVFTDTDDTLAANSDKRVPTQKSNYGLYCILSCSF